MRERNMVWCEPAIVIYTHEHNSIYHTHAACLHWGSNPNSTSMSPNFILIRIGSHTHIYKWIGTRIVIGTELNLDWNPNRAKTVLGII